MTHDWNTIRTDQATLAAYRQVMLTSFKAFCISVFRYNYKKEFIWAEHIDEISRNLLAVWAGKTRNLLVNVAPRYGKTDLLCMFVAWCYAHNPSCEFMHLSYSDDLALRNSDRIRSIIKSQMFHDLFGVEIDEDNNKKDTWRTTAGGIFKASATGGQVTGFGAGSTTERAADGTYTFSGCIWIDDPLKPKDANSTNREAVNDHWDETIKSRRNSPETTPTICIMQRLHEGDFSAHLMADTAEAFKVVKLKTLRDDGTALWPMKHTAATLEAMRKTNVYVFASQYQQEPTPSGGSLFKANWWHKYIEEPVFDRVIITADTAQKIREHNDFSVFQAWGKVEKTNRIYLIDQIRGKWEAPDLKRVAIEFIRGICSHYSCHSVHIEDKASGTGLIQSLQPHTSAAIIPIQRNKDKVTRAYDTAPHIQAAQVFLPEGKPFTDMFIAECSGFSPEMTHLHDDQIDPMMDAVEILLGTLDITLFDVL